MKADVALNGKVLVVAAAAAAVGMSKSSGPPTKCVVARSKNALLCENWPSCTTQYSASSLTGLAGSWQICLTHRDRCSWLASVQMQQKLKVTN